jgi:glutamate dehydrogenase/leucine dehydrogenase
MTFLRVLVRPHHPAIAVAARCMHHPANAPSASGAWRRLAYNNLRPYLVVASFSTTTNRGSAQRNMATAPTKYTPRDGDSVMALFSLKGKTAIVTGAGAGIGYAVAEAYAEAGANVALWYNSNDAAIKKAEELGKRFGVKGLLFEIPTRRVFLETRADYSIAKAYKVQITSQEAVEKATDQVVEEFNGRLDIFVANAGIPWTKGDLLDAANVTSPPPFRDYPAPR